MKLRITTPLEVVVEDDDVKALKAEDPSGSFGIMAGHTDFLTSLAVSVISWTRGNGEHRFCAVRHGVLTVTNGTEIAVATREAIVGDDLGTLEKTVLSRFHEEQEEERTGRTESTRLQLNAIRQIMRHLRPGGSHIEGGMR